MCEHMCVTVQEHMCVHMHMCIPVSTPVSGRLCVTTVCAFDFFYVTFLSFPSVCYIETCGV